MSPSPGRPGVYVDETPGRGRAIAGAATSVTAFVGRAGEGPVNRPTVVHGFAEYARVFGGLDDPSPLGPSVHHYFANGGREAVIVRAAPGPGADDPDPTGDRAARTGLYALDDADPFQLLCLLPPSMDSDVAAASYAAAADYCEERRAMLLIDPPRAARDPAAVVRYIEGLPAMARRNAAAYFPRVRLASPSGGRPLDDFPPSGIIAGVIARIDARRGVWKAPAGREATLRGVDGLAHALTRREQGELNGRGINGLRTFPRIGTAIWGARTLDGTDTGASDWKYVPVRRVALFIEASVHESTEWAVFEPNAEPVWVRIRQSVGDFLDRLWRRGAFRGATPRDAYFVRCGRDSTSRHDIDRGLIDILIGFAPLKPAEFVIVRIRRRVGPGGG